MTTLASDIIQRAYREGNITAIVSSPTSDEQNEALSLLNPLLLLALGTKAGQELRDINIGGTYDESSCVSTWAPANARLVLNLSTAQTINLHPQPYEGMRLAIADAGSNLATHNLILNGNGRQIEGAATLTLNTNATVRQWLYRADTANWVKMTALALSNVMPFPQDFDDYFVVKLAMRLFPRNGVKMTAESAAMLKEAETALRARYRKPRPANDMPTMARGNDPYGLSTSDFYAGRTQR